MDEDEDDEVRFLKNNDMCLLQRVLSWVFCRLALFVYLIVNMLFFVYLQLVVHVKQIKKYLYEK